MKQELTQYSKNALAKKIAEEYNEEKCSHNNQYVHDMNILPFKLVIDLRFGGETAQAQYS